MKYKIGNILKLSILSAITIAMPISVKYSITDSKELVSNSINSHDYQNFEGILYKGDKLLSADGQGFFLEVHSSANKTDDRMDDIYIKYIAAEGYDMNIPNVQAWIRPIVSNPEWMKEGEGPFPYMGTPFGSWEHYDLPEISRNSEEIIFGPFTTSQQSEFLVDVIRDNWAPVGSAEFFNNSFRFAPTYKYQLVRSEGNNNPDRKEIWNTPGFGPLLEDGTHMPAKKSHPSSWGEFDLELEFREPSIHQNSWMSTPSKNEYNDIRNWLRVDTIKYDVTLDIPPSSIHNYIDIKSRSMEEAMNDPTNFSSIQEESKFFINGSYSTNESLNTGTDFDIGQGGHVTEFTVSNNGYIKLKIKNVVDIPESRYVWEKGDDNGHGINLTIDETNEKNKEYQTKYWTPEGTSNVVNYGWGQKRLSDPWPYFIENSPIKNNKNIYGYDFSSNPIAINQGVYRHFTIIWPIHIAGMLLGIIWLFFFVNRFTSKKRYKNMINIFKNPVEFFIYPEEEIVENKNDLNIVLKPKIKKNDI